MVQSSGSQTAVHSSWQNGSGGQLRISPDEKLYGIGNEAPSYAAAVFWQAFSVVDRSADPV